MIRKTVADARAALEGVRDGMTLMLGGFGLCGIPENAITELVRRGVAEPPDQKDDLVLCGRK